MAVSYNVNAANTLKLSFGTRINRPGISYLNPAVNETPTSTSSGNPNLSSARNNSLSLNYNLIGNKVNMDFSAGYNFSNNDIVAVKWINNDHTYSNYANAGKNKSFNAGLYFQWMAGKKTTVMLNGNTTYNHYANPSINITHGGWSGHLYSRLSQKLPWKLTGQLGISLWSGNIGGLYDRTSAIGIAMFDYNISLQRSFLKEDRLTVRIHTWNPIYPGTVRYKFESANLPAKSVSYSYRDLNTSFGIAISYRFGSINAQVKKTAKSIQNDDLSGRKL